MGVTMRLANIGRSRLFACGSPEQFRADFDYRPKRIFIGQRLLLRRLPRPVACSDYSQGELTAEESRFHQVAASIDLPYSMADLQAF